jgi:ABC-type molybdate transport system substrate-binding protein
MKPVLSRAVALSLLALPAAAAPAEPPLAFMASVISKAAMTEVIAACERDTGLKTAVHWATNPVLKQEIEAGAKFDVVAIEPEMATDLAGKGLVDGASVVLVGRAGMALVSKTGGPTLDLSNVDRFKQVLLDARAVSYSADGFSGVVLARTLEQMGLTAAMKPKLVPVTDSQDGKLGVVDDRAQYYAGPITMVGPGMQPVGLFPEQHQTYIGVSAATSPGAAASPAAKAWIQCLRGSSAQAIFRAKGYVVAG